MKNLLPLLFLILTACGTQSVFYPTGTSEALVSFPANNKQIQLLNRINLRPTEVFNQDYYTPSLANGLNGALSGFRSEVYNRKYFTLNTSLNQFQEIGDGNFPKPLTPKQIQGAAGNADILVVLEMFDQVYRDDYRIEIRRQDLGNKTYKEVDFIVGKRTIIFKLGWKTYSAKTGTILDEKTYNEEYFYEAESLERVRATQLLNANFPKELGNLGSRLGADYASRISPTNHYTYRTIYTSGNKWLEKGAIDVRKENWNDAEQEWQRGIKQEVKRKKLAKLYHNLAILAERSGDLTQAKEYAKLAANQHPIGNKTQNAVGY
jgi:hypothetical protein